MTTYALGQLTTDQLRDLVAIDNAGMEPARWEAREGGTLLETEQALLAEPFHLRAYEGWRCMQLRYGLFIR